MWAVVRGSLPEASKCCKGLLSAMSRIVNCILGRSMHMIALVARTHEHIRLRTNVAFMYTSISDKSLESEVATCPSPHDSLAHLSAHITHQ
jgi:hypothetical protein